MNRSRIYADVVAEYDREKVRKAIAFALKTYPEQWNNIVMNENGIIKPEPDRETYGDWWHIILVGIIKSGVCKDFREVNLCMSAMRHEVRI